MTARVHLSLKRQVAKLTKIGIALSSELDLERLLNMIVQEARRLLNCDAGSLYTLEGDHLRFRVAQSAALGLRESAAALRPILLKLDKSRIATYVALTGRPLNIPDVYKIPRSAEYGFKHDLDAMMGYKTRSVLAVPIRDREQEIIGVLQLINALDGKGRAVPDNVVPFSEDCVDLAMALASQAGVAMRNAQLLDDLRALFHGIVRFSSAAIDARDPSAVGHSRRVSELVIRMAHAINRSRAPRFAKIHFTPAQIEALRYAGLLHDVGKVAISEDLLRKGRRLSLHDLETIRLRFAAIRQTMINNALERKIRLQQLRRDPKEIAAVDEELKAQLEELSQDLDFIARCSGSDPLGPVERKCLAVIASKKFVTPKGGEFIYLTKEEFEHLSVPRGTLTPEELVEVRRHASETARFLSEIPFRGALKDTPRLAALHHEMLDGSGYPYGLKGDEVPLEARMLVVADVFDAMTAADRPYRKAFSLRKALRVLREEAQKNRLDRDLVDMFCRRRLYRPFPILPQEDPGFSQSKGKSSMV